jgi:diacylglycerol kinase (ATP)
MVDGFLKSFIHAGRGIAAGIRGCRNMQIMLAAGVAAVALGLVLGLTRGEWTAVALAIGLVLAVELVNTAGEGLVDLLHPEHDPRWGRIKDLLAGASLLAALAAAAVGALVFGPRLWP